MSPEGETEIVLEKPKRTPRKRTPKVSSDDAVAAAVVKRTPRKQVQRKLIEVEEQPATRKAPTPIAAAKAKLVHRRKNTLVVSALLLVGVGASAAVGFTDRGQIDVIQTIAQRNETARATGQPELTIPVQDTQEPNDGLIGLGDNPPSDPQANSPVATSTESTASTTEAVASSTSPEISAQ